MKESDMIKLTLLGDIMCLPPQDEAARVCEGTYDYNSVFDPIRTFLAESDLVIGNLETNFAGEDMVYSNTRASFNTPDSFAEALKAAGVKAVSTANNHCLDRGIVGLKRTLDVLDNVGILHTGTYRDERESEEILNVSVNGIRIALISATYGTNSEFNHCFLLPEEQYAVDMLRRQTPEVCVANTLNKTLRRLIASFIPQQIKKILRPHSDIITPLIDCVPDGEITLPENIQYLNRIKEKVAQAKKMADIVIVAPHIGGQYNDKTGKYTDYVLEELKATEADIIIANHPHCILPYQLFGNSKILTRAIGNFCFTPDWGYWVDGVFSEYSIILHIYYDSGKQSISKITYSIAKNISDSNNYTRVYLLYDLIEDANDEDTKRCLKEDMYKVMSRFNEHATQKDEVCEREYTIFEK